MITNHQPSAYNFSNFEGQFILTKKNEFIPPGWEKFENGKWFLGVLCLPVIEIVSINGKKIGWFIGYPLNDKIEINKSFIIEGSDNGYIDQDAIENIYLNTGGRYIIILLESNEEKLFLDAAGSFGVVYSTKLETIASTTTLLGQEHDWDEDVINTLGMPGSDRWFPSGLTPKKGIKRVLPNHCLDLKDWIATRHWPRSKADLLIEANVEELVSQIISNIRQNIASIVLRHHIMLSLTAGRDSRVILACAKDFIPDALFFTFAENKETVDMQISSLLAKNFNLNHQFIPIKHASEDELENWLAVTGHSVSGEIWRIHKTIEDLDPKRVLLTGIGGEVGRSYYWKKGDRYNTPLTAKELLFRAHLPFNEKILNNTELWLKELTGFNTFNILDLFYLEQRLGCWAAPQSYGNTTSVFEISPFNHRRIFRSMMKLPYKYRFKQELSYDICKKIWPELLEFPFNKFIGYKYYTYRFNRIYSKVKRLRTRL